MKKSFFALLGAIPFLYGCASTPQNLKDFSPVAIMTVYSNPSVPWYDEKTNSESVEDGILSGAVNRLINKKNPEHEERQERINQASALLSEKMREFGLEVIDPTTNKDCSSYKEAGSGITDYLGNTVPAQGYEAITSSNGKRNRNMCRESGAKSVLYVNFRFQKVMAKEGVHNKGVAARLVMSVFGTDSSGKKIISKEYKAVSEGYADLIKSSNWDKEKVLSFYPDLEEQIITQFLTEFVLGGESPEAKDFVPSPIKMTKKAPPAEAKTSENGQGKISTEAEDAVLAEKRATAKKLLERGMSAQEASEITGIPVEEIGR
ncbi:MAG: hypothetical protein IKO39_02950 [Treponema sp.]|nr:hypothetical protein [Treponema sp.]